MIGSIIGDIAGSVYEFNNAKTEDFPLITKQSNYTDDTICTIAVADAVMNSWNFKDALVEWCLSYPHPMGCYGASFAAWLNSKEHLPYNSFGNGAAMRVSSIGWLCNTQYEVCEAAKMSAEVSHDHPEGIYGAQAVALEVFGLRQGRSKDEIKDFISQHYTIPKYEPFSNPFDETCQNAVPVAVSCFLASNSFDDAIRKAIVVGGDSDTIAAICGSLAEAHYGVPAGLRAAALKKLPADMLGVIRQFESTIGRIE